MRNDPVTKELARVASSDPALWGRRIAHLALEPRAGVSLRAARPGWIDREIPADAAAMLLAHPQAHPDDTMRAFRCEALGATVTVIARNGVIGAHAAHDGGTSALCHDVCDEDDWRHVRRDRTPSGD